MAETDGNWKRNLYTIWVAEFVALMGWGVIQPFLPYFIQELGVTDLAQIELYSGMAFAAHGVVMTVTAPLWGALADRYGRKLMVERAMISGAILYYLTSFVQDVPSLMLMRALTGGLTGTVAAATTLVASGTPRERIGYAMGMLQMALYAGSLVGPLVGGVVADAWGYRASMQVTAGLWILSALMVHLLVRESFEPSASGVGRPGLLQGLREVMSNQALRAIFAVRVILRLGDRTLMPILPLFVQGLILPGAKIASVTGVVVGISGAASAAGALLLGRVSDRVGPRRVLLGCTLGAAAFYAPCFAVSEVWQLAALQAAASFFVGGTLTSVSTMLAGLAPPGKQGAVYGVDQSASSVGNAVAPMLGATVAMSLGLGATFVFVAVFYAAAWVAVSRLLSDPAK
jgi:DHA1 family multidrug resistance protein-like MFS transporter